MTNTLGQQVNLTGHQCFVKVNSVNLLIGDASVTTPPALPAFLAATVTALTADVSDAAIKLAGTSPAAGTKFMVFASPQVSAGVSFQGDFRYIQTFTAAAGGFFDISTVWIARFGALIAGKKVFVKVVQSQAGMQDNGTLFNAIVTA
jgi:cold shock CspA family protein